MSILCASLVLLAMPVSADTVERVPPASTRSAAVASAVDAWQDTVEAHSQCLGTVAIRFEDLPGRRGEYRTSEAVVIVDEHTPEPEVGFVVVHELAHHVFIACRLWEDDAFRRAFYDAAGLPVDRSWFDYSSGWHETPAEVFAEAVTAIVLGRTAHGIDVSAPVLGITEMWLAGRRDVVVEASVARVSPVVEPDESTPELLPSRWRREPVPV